MHPWFPGCLGRRWCANARLVDWDFDDYRVAKWLGHESVGRLKNDYEQEARLHAELYGRGWLGRAFKAAGPKEH